MPEPSQLTPFDVEEQRLYSELPIFWLCGSYYVLSLVFDEYAFIKNLHKLKEKSVNAKR